MSIINQMLKDLEKRQMAPAPLGEMQTVQYIERYSRNTKIALGLGFVLLAFVFFLLSFYEWIYPFKMPMHANARKIPVNDVGSALSIVEENRQGIASPLMGPTLITGIGLESNGSATHLHLMLNQEPLYRVSEDYEKNRLIITLDNARLLASMPQLDTVSDTIKDIRMAHDAEHHLQIMITLQTNVEMQRLELSSSETSPELQVDFVNQTLAQGSPSIKRMNYDSEAEQDYQQVMTILAAGHHQKAMQLLQGLLKRNPDFSPARERLGVLLIEEGEDVKAKQLVEIGLQQKPYYPAFVILKARMLVKEGKVGIARRLLEMAPPPLEENPDYHAFIAALYQQLGEYPLAASVYEKLLRVQSDNPVWLVGLGIALENMGKQAQAQQLYLRANRMSDLSAELKSFIEMRIPSSFEDKA